MRLSQTDVKAILDCFRNVSTPDVYLYLIGSRVDDNKRGGDIDLLAVFASDDQRQQFSKLDFVVSLKKSLGERRIDVTMALKTDLDNDPFLKSVMPTAIKLS
jgi:hypothetical protein